MSSDVVGKLHNWKCLASGHLRVTGLCSVKKLTEESKHTQTRKSLIFQRCAGIWEFIKSWPGLLVKIKFWWITVDKLWVIFTMLNGGGKSKWKYHFTMHKNYLKFKIMSMNKGSPGIRQCFSASLGQSWAVVTEHAVSQNFYYWFHTKELACSPLNAAPANTADHTSLPSHVIIAFPTSDCLVASSVLFCEPKCYITTLTLEAATVNRCK